MQRVHFYALWVLPKGYSNQDNFFKKIVQRALHESSSIFKHLDVAQWL